MSLSCHAVLAPIPCFPKIFRPRCCHCHLIFRLWLSLSLLWLLCCCLSVWSDNLSQQWIVPMANGRSICKSHSKKNKGRVTTSSYCASTIIWLNHITSHSDFDSDSDGYSTSTAAKGSSSSLSEATAPAKGSWSSSSHSSSSTNSHQSTSHVIVMPCQAMPHIDLALAVLAPIPCFPKMFTPRCCHCHLIFRLWLSLVCLSVWSNNLSTVWGTQDKVTLLLHIKNINHHHPIYRLSPTIPSSVS